MMDSAVDADVIARLHAVYRDGDPDGRTIELPSLPSEFPSAVNDVLRQRDLQFAQLPRTLQFALMWDAGVILTDGGTELRTHCGLTITAALQVSTLSLPACAVSSTYQPGRDRGVAWFESSRSSPFPRMRISLGGTKPSDSEILGLCSTEPAGFDAFCPPAMSPQINSWLSSTANASKSPQSVESPAPGHPGAQLDFSGNAASTPRVGQSALTSLARGLGAEFVSTYYELHERRHSYPQLKLANAVPADVQTRLDASELTFSKITGLLQRALLWDTGYVLVQRSNNSVVDVDVVPVYVKCGETMGDIAMGRGYFAATGCPIQDCSWKNESSEDIIYSYRAKDCNEQRGSGPGSIELTSLIRCAIPSNIQDSGVEVPLATVSTVWAIGNLSSSNHSTIPNMWLKRYPSLSHQYVIHQSITEVKIGTCPVSPSFIIPCLSLDQPSLHKDWCRPIQSELITSWLHQEKQQEMALALLILLASAILLALALDLFADRKPRFFTNGRVSVSMPSLTSTVLEPGPEQSQDQSQLNSFQSDRRGWSSIRSARSAR